MGAPVVRRLTPGAADGPVERRVTLAPGPRTAGGRGSAGVWPPDAPWRPRAVLGARSEGGLLLPDASASASTLYGPRGVWLDGARVIAADTGNHRVLIWHDARDGAPADVVVGHDDFDREGECLLRMPTGVLVDGERLVVADAWHHRILVWDAVPACNGQPPDHVLGQPAGGVEPNAGGEPTAATFYWPFGIALVDGRFHVADTGNRRVLIWDAGLPLDGRPADVVLGQPDAASREENRGGDVAPDSFRWPHAFGSVAGALLIADAGNHRVLRWDAPPRADGPAAGVLGQPDLRTGTEFPYVSQDGRLRFPYGLATGPGVAVADTANNRVLVWDGAPGGTPDAILGQPDPSANGENRWDAVAADTLCWPYGLARDGDRLAIADSGNNRVVIWARG